jgi:PAS domain S-box-containing protein
MGKEELLALHTAAFDSHSLQEFLDVAAHLILEQTEASEVDIVALTRFGQVASGHAEGGDSSGSYTPFTLNLEWEDRTVGRLVLEGLPADSRPLGHLGEIQRALARIVNFRLTLLSSSRPQLLNEAEAASERFRSITASIPGAVYQYLVSAEGNHSLVYISESAEKLFGYSLEELKGPELLVHGVVEEDRAAFRESIEHSLATLTPWNHEYRAQRSDGSVAWIRGRSVPQKLSDGAVLWNGVLMEVTAEKEAINTVRRKDAWLNGLLDALPDMVFELSRDGRILNYWGGARADLFLPPERFVGTHIRDSAPETCSGPALRALERLFVEGETQQFQHSADTYEGLHFYETRLARVDDERALCVTRRVTDRVLAERRVEDGKRELRKLARRLQEIREEERSRVAREIHDTVGQSLTSFIFDIHWLRRHAETGAVTERLTKLSDDMERLDQEVRRIGTSLRPRILDDFGIVAALDWLAKEFTSRFKIDCIFEAPVLPVQSSDDVATALFRIAQEALTNTVRHSEASFVRISLHQDQKSITMTVSDNGVGFSVDSSSSVDSTGLVGMQERASALSGHVKLMSHPEIGTTVEAVFPRGERSHD